MLIRDTHKDEVSSVSENVCETLRCLRCWLPESPSVKPRKPTPLLALELDNPVVEEDD